MLYGRQLTLNILRGWIIKPFSYELTAEQCASCFSICIIFFQFSSYFYGPYSLACASFSPYHVVTSSGGDVCVSVGVCGSGGDGNTNIHSQSPVDFHGDDVELGRAGCHGYRGHSSHRWNDCAMCKGVNGSLLNTKQVSNCNLCGF